MNHMLYLSDERPVCEYPERLGTDFIAANGNNCPECSALLFAHNKKAFESESLLAAKIVQVPKKKEMFESQGAAFYAGVLLSCFIWGFIISFLWAFGWIR